MDKNATLTYTPFSHIEPVDDTFLQKLNLSFPGLASWLSQKAATSPLVWENVAVELEEKALRLGASKARDRDIPELSAFHLMRASRLICSLLDQLDDSGYEADEEYAFFCQVTDLCKETFGSAALYAWYSADDSVMPAGSASAETLATRLLDTCATITNTVTITLPTPTAPGHVVASTGEVFSFYVAAGSYQEKLVHHLSYRFPDYVGEVVFPVKSIACLPDAACGFVLALRESFTKVKISDQLTVPAWECSWDQLVPVVSAMQDCVKPGQWQQLENLVASWEGTLDDLVSALMGTSV